MGEPAIKQEWIYMGMGIAEWAFAQDLCVLVGLQRGQALDGVWL